MDWNRHPLSLAVTTAVATTIFWITIFFTVIIPTWVRSDEVEIAALRKQVGEFGTATAVLKAKSTRIAELEAELTKLRYGWTNVFEPSQPYPKQFPNLRVGDEIAHVQRAYAYSRERVEVLDDWLTIPSGAGPFESATVYFEATARPRTVTHILYHLRFPDGSKVVVNEATKAFGRERLTYSNRNGIEQWKWGNIGTMNVEIDRTLYHVTPW